MEYVKDMKKSPNLDIKNPSKVEIQLLVRSNKDFFN